MTTSPMKIGALAPWFGGKRTMAPRIVRELGEHSAYWEPFAGGISILLAKPRCRQEVINDLHGDVTNLAMVLASDAAPVLYDRAYRTLYSESLFDACKAAVSAPAFEFAEAPETVQAEHVSRAYAYLVLSWMGRNGAAGTARINYQFTLRYTANGGDSARRWAQVCDSIPAWADRLRGVVISRRDGIALAEKVDDVPGTAMYLDPPYVKEGDAYAHTFATGTGGMFDQRDDHARLAEVARVKKHTRIVVSYYEDPRLDELYPGWTRVACKMNKALAVQNKRGAERTEAPEVLLINGPSYMEGK